MKSTESAPGPLTRRTAAFVGALLGASLSAGCAGDASRVDSAPAHRAAKQSDELIAARGDGPHASFDAFLDAHFSGEAWREDVAHGYFETSSVLLPAGLVLGAGAIAPWDHTISRNTRNSSPTFGDATLAALLVGTAAVGVFAPGEGRDGAEERWTIGETFAVDLAATEVLKIAVGRRRPDSGSRVSFASGHASMAFAAATLIDRNSGHGLGIPAYVLAVATGVSRVESRRHFPSDVFVGAALGALTAGIVDALHFGGEVKGEGISKRRSASGRVGIEAGADGRPVVSLTLQF